MLISNVGVGIIAALAAFGLINYNSAHTQVGGYKIIYKNRGTGQVIYEAATELYTVNIEALYPTDQTGEEDIKPLAVYEPEIKSFKKWVILRNTLKSIAIGLSIYYIIEFIKEIQANPNKEDKLLEDIEKYNYVNNKIKAEKNSNPPNINLLSE